MNVQIGVNTPKNPYLDQPTPKRYIVLAKFSYPKNPSIIPVTWNAEYLPGVSTPSGKVMKAAPP